MFSRKCPVPAYPLIPSGVRNENKSRFILHFARFSLSLQHDVRNTSMDEIEKNNQIVATLSRQLSQKIGDGSDDPQKIMVPLHREYKIGRYEGYRITRNRACMS